MIHRFLLRSWLLLGVWLALATAAAADEHVTLPGGAAGIWNIAGAVTVERGTGTDVVVYATALGADAGRLRFETGVVRGRQSFRVIYPNRHVIYSAPGFHGRSSGRVRSDGTFNDGKGYLGSPVDVSSMGFGLHAWADLRVQVPAGGQVAIYTLAGPLTARNVDGELRLDGGSSPVSATGGRGSLTVDVGSGEVSVSDHRGDVLVDTGSGRVRLDRVDGDKVDVDTGSGSVAAADVHTRYLHVDTGSGDVSVDGADATRVSIDTGSGSVTMRLLTRDPDVLVDTGSGGVRLAVPEDFSASLDLDVGSGGIECELPVANMSRDHGSLTGRIGDGRGRVKVDTGSGGVRLTRAVR